MSIAVEDQTINSVSTRILSLSQGVIVRHMDIPVAGPYDVTARESSGTSRTITIGAHNIVVGDFMSVNEMDDSDYDSFQEITTTKHFVLVTAVDATTVTYTHEASKSEGSVAETSGKCMVSKWKELALTIRTAINAAATMQEAGVPWYYGLSADDNPPATSAHYTGLQSSTTLDLIWWALANTFYQGLPAFVHIIDGAVQNVPSMEVQGVFYSGSWRDAHPAITAPRNYSRSLTMRFVKSVTGESYVHVYREGRVTSSNYGFGYGRQAQELKSGQELSFVRACRRQFELLNPERWQLDQQTTYYENTFENASIGPLNRFVFGWPWATPIEICEMGFTVRNPY